MLYRALRLLRTFHDLSQTELAADLEVSNSYISELEAGKKTPTLDIVNRYAKRFKIPASSILLFSEKLEKEPGGARVFLARLALGVLEEIEGNGDGEGTNEDAISH